MGVVLKCSFHNIYPIKGFHILFLLYLPVKPTHAITGGASASDLCYSLHSGVFALPPSAAHDIVFLLYDITPGALTSP